MSGVGQKHGQRGQWTIEEDEINTEGLLYTYINVVTYLKMKIPDRKEPFGLRRY